MINGDQGVVARGICALDLSELTEVSPALLKTFRELLAVDQAAARVRPAEFVIRVSCLPRVDR
jgi:hypothetical protein